MTHNRRSLVPLFVSTVVVMTSVLLYGLMTGGEQHPVTCTLLGFGCPQVVTEGFVDSRYNSVKQAFIKNYEVGRDAGSCITAYVKGEKVVDLCGGHRDAEGKQPYRGSLQLVNSCTKVVSQIVVAMLVDKGLLKYDEKIATYWPEFAQGGKENVTVADLVQHAAGVSWLDSGLLTYAQIADFDVLAEIIAKQKHNFNSVRTTAYHAITQGFFINELVRRLDPQGRSLGQFIRQEINKPLGIEFYLGLDQHKEPEIYSRYSALKAYPKLSMFLKVLTRVLADLLLFGNPLPFKRMMNARMDKSSPTYRSMNVLEKDFQGNFNNPEYHRLEVAAANGITDAQSLAKLAALMANRGEIDGVRLLSPETVNLAVQAQQGEEWDQVLFMPLNRTLGGWTLFDIPHHENKAIGWSGMGGSLMVWEPVNQVSFAYVMNTMELDIGARAFPIVTELLKVVKSSLQQ